MKVLKNSNWQKFTIHIDKLWQFECSIFSFLKELYFFMETFLYSWEIFFTLFNILYIRDDFFLETYIFDKMWTRRKSLKLLRGQSYGVYDEKCDIDIYMFLDSCGQVLLKKNQKLSTLMLTSNLAFFFNLCKKKNHCELDHWSIWTNFASKYA